MLALIYLALLVLLGDAVCRRFFTYLSIPHRFAVAFLSGLLFSSWWTYLAALAFSGSNSPLFWGNIVFFSTATGAIFLLRRRPLKQTPGTTIDRDSTEFKKADWIITGVFLIFISWMMFSTFNMADGKLEIANHQSSDFGSTVSIMQSFAVGHNFPTEYPHFSGDRIRYHFLFYFQAGNLEYLGLNPALSNNILSILSLLSMLILVMTLGTVLFASRVVGRIGAALFFFHGSLAFIPFFMANGPLSVILDKVWTMRDFLTSGLPYRGEAWGVWSQVVYLNQRHLASSIGIFLLVLVFLFIRYREKSEVERVIEPLDGGETDSELNNEPENLTSEIPVVVQPRLVERYASFVLAGLLIGLMPLWNGAIFTSAAAVLAILFLLFPFRKEMIALAISSAIVALPQIAFLKTGMLRPSEFSLFHWGYTVDDATFFNVIYYLIFTFGLKWLLIAVALIFGSWLQRKFIVAVSVLILVATCFQFSEEVLANHKFFNVWLVLINIPVGYALVKLWNLLPGKTVIVGRLAVIVLVLGITIGGVIDLFPIKNSFWVTFGYTGDPLIEWVKANTDPRSIFLSHRYVNHGILLAGRRLFYGHPYYAWGAGYPTFQRDEIYKKMFESRDMTAVFRLLKENNINYVAIDNAVRRGDFIKRPNEQIFEAYFPLVYTDAENKYDGLKIYSVPDVLGEPNPNVPLMPVVLTVNAARPEITGAFRGGEGNGFGQFSKPRGIAGDAKGNFYVADTGNSRVQKFDQNGQFISILGQAGPGEGELSEPNGVAITDDGSVYVTDALNQKLVRFSRDGKFIKEWKGPDPGFYGPRDIAIGPNKVLYIVDQGRTRIVKFDPATEAFTSWGTAGSGENQFNEPTGIAVGANLVFITDAGNNRIQVFNLDGNFVRQWPVPVWDKYIWHYPDAAFDEQTKRLYVTSGWTNEVIAFDIDGNLVDSGFKPDGDDKLGNPSAICILQEKKERLLLIVNTGGQKISSFNIESAKQ